MFLGGTGSFVEKTFSKASLADLLLKMFPILGLPDLAEEERSAPFSLVAIVEQRERERDDRNEEQRWGWKFRVFGEEDVEEDNREEGEMISELGSYEYLRERI